MSVQALASEPHLQELNAYITETWIDELWLPTYWSCHRWSIRINNDVESLHACFNWRTGAGTLRMHHLAERLYEEAKLVLLMMKTMSDRKVAMPNHASIAVDELRASVLELSSTTMSMMPAIVPQQSC